MLQLLRCFYDMDAEQAYRFFSEIIPNVSHADANELHKEMKKTLECRLSKTSYAQYLSKLKEIKGKYENRTKK